MIIRRTTLEWVLRQAVLREPTVDYRTGVAVAGLVGAGGAGGAGGRGRGTVTGATVTGVRLADGEVVEGDAVVASTGRRGDVPGWLGALGIDVPESIRESGLMYLTRWYRLADGFDAGEARPQAGRRPRFREVSRRARRCRHALDHAGHPVRRRRDTTGLVGRGRFRVRAKPAAARARPVLRGRTAGAVGWGAADGRAAQPFAAFPRRRRAADRAGFPRGGRRPHVYQPALWARLLRSPWSRPCISPTPSGATRGIRRRALSITRPPASATWSRGSRSPWRWTSWAPTPSGVGATKWSGPSPMSSWPPRPTARVLGRGLARFWNLMATPAEMASDPQYLARVADVMAAPEKYPLYDRHGTRRAPICWPRWPWAAPP